MKLDVPSSESDLFECKLPYGTALCQTDRLEADNVQFFYISLIFIIEGGKNETLIAFLEAVLQCS